jgi:cysteate synthase
MPYSLHCIVCDETIKDNYTLACPHCNSLLRTSYADRFKPPMESGLGRFRSWLPVPDDFSYPAAPVVFKSQGLANELDLENLWIAFNGYWPERHADMRTCTFKELEAPTTFARAKACGVNTLILASVGNTGRAFAAVGGKLGFRTVILIPDLCKDTFWLPEEKADCIKLISVSGHGDYLHTIEIANRIGHLMGFTNEGGHRNVARRDGMSVVAMAAYDTMGKVPDHYFQAVGSGTGGIGSYEFYHKLISSGVPANLPRFHLVQGHPFVPMVKAWRSGRKELTPEDIPRVCRNEGYLSDIYAKVLTNRSPPYSPKGGVHEVLTRTKGQMYGVEEEMAKIASTLFQRSEGIDIVPASQVCVAGLMKALDEGEIGRKDQILLNITGGGEARFDADIGKHFPKFDAQVSGPSASDEELRGLFRG